jgi:hypothetical protein
MKIDGACHCGFITFEAEVDPAETSLCHCTDCQTLSGAPFRVSIPVAPNDFRLLSGEPTIYIKTAESGRKRAQAFCPRCGSPIYATSPDDSTAAYNIRLGAIRQRDELIPRRQVWTRSKQSWVGELAAIPGIEKA